MAEEVDRALIEQKKAEIAAKKAEKAEAEVKSLKTEIEVLKAKIEGLQVHKERADQIRESADQHKENLKELLILTLRVCFEVKFKSRFVGGIQGVNKLYDDVLKHLGNEGENIVKEMLGANRTPSPDVRHDGKESTLGRGEIPLWNGQVTEVSHPEMMIEKRGVIPQWQGPHI